MAERLVDEETLEELGRLLEKVARRVERDLAHRTGEDIESSADSPEDEADESDGGAD